MDDEYDENANKISEWIVQEQIEIYMIALMSVKEMVDSLFQGINKYRVMLTPEILLLREAVKTLDSIIR